MIYFNFWDIFILIFRQLALLWVNTLLLLLCAVICSVVYIGSRVTQICLQQRSDSLPADNIV